MIQTLTPRSQWKPQTLSRVDSVHEALEQALVCEEAGPAFRARLQRYAPFLAAELDEEEGPEGVLGEVLELDPGLGWRVAQFRREHARLLEGLRDLIDLLEREPADSPQAWARRRHLHDALVRHRRAEQRLLLDAHFLDLGGEGAA